MFVLLLPDDNVEAQMEPYIDYIPYVCVYIHMVYTKGPRAVAMQLGKLGPGLRFTLFEHLRFGAGLGLGFRV